MRSHHWEERVSRVPSLLTVKVIGMVSADEAAAGTTRSVTRPASWYSRNRHRYGEAWPAIAHAVKTDAGWQCEACGAPHGPPPHVLTVDHLDHVPENMDRENLVALCQRCHLRRQGLRPRPADKAEALERLRRYQENEDAQGGLFDG